MKDGKLDMPALMAAFQDFWRENATPESFVSQNFHEAYPHFVLQAFLQRVVNGGGQIIREMAIGRGRLDLGVVFGNEKYAVEVKTAALYAEAVMGAKTVVWNGPMGEPRYANGSQGRTVPPLDLNLGSTGSHSSIICRASTPLSNHNSFLLPVPR